MRKPVPGFPDIYAEPSGKIFRGNEELTCYADDVGHPALTLKRHDGGRQKVKAATIIARAFLDLVVGARCRIAYIDGDAWNLAVENLILQDSSKRLDLPSTARQLPDDDLAVTDTGEVFIRVDGGWRRCPPFLSEGYHVVHIRKDGVTRTLRVNNLVARAFHGDPPVGRPYACHRNGIRTDNRADNLYWGSPADNSLDCRRHNQYETQVIVRTDVPTRVRPMGDHHPVSKVTRHQVLEIRRAHRRLLMANMDMARAVGLSESGINFILCGKTWRHLLPFQDEHDAVYGDAPPNLSRESNGTTH